MFDINLFLKFKLISLIIFNKKEKLILLINLFSFKKIILKFNL